MLRPLAGCGSGLARDAGAAVPQLHCSDPIAGKPAPTENWRPPITFRTQSKKHYLLFLYTKA
ncbi:hypothetical protein EU514_13720 [Pseudomonas fragi]|nr:hypothetical protein [Pseudomonas fragi]